MADGNLDKKDAEELLECESIKKTLLLANKKWDRTFNALPDLITIMDTEHRVVKVNQAMADSMGVSPEKAIGKHCYEMVHGTRCPIDTCPHTLLLVDGAQHKAEIQEDNLGGFFLVTVSPIKDEEGKIVGSVHVARDITQRIKMENDLKKALKDKNMLMKEIHHRVKNNLTIMSSLLNLQSRYIEDESTRAIFKDSQSRVKTMALIHEKLYRSGNLKLLNMKEYIEELSRDLSNIHLSNHDNVDLVLDLENIMLDVDTAIPLGLIINELLTNSVKHAFPENQKGTINVNFRKEEDGELLLEVKDNGKGLPSNFKIENSDSLGLRLIHSLTDQIHGQIEVDGSQGAHFSIKFRERKKGEKHK